MLRVPKIRGLRRVEAMWRGGLSWGWGHGAHDPMTPEMQGILCPVRGSSSVDRVTPPFHTHSFSLPVSLTHTHACTHTQMHTRAPAAKSACRNRVATITSPSSPCSFSLLPLPLLSFPFSVFPLFFLPSFLLRLLSSTAQTLVNTITQQKEVFKSKTLLLSLYRNAVNSKRIFLRCLSSTFKPPLW